MVLNNLRITRIAAHEVFLRNDDRTMVEPRYGEEVIRLSTEALEELADRIVSALGRASRSMDMDIINSDAGSAVDLSRRIISAVDDRGFVDVSKRVADKLADAQASRSIPGGVLVVIGGEVGYPARKMVAHIKAEVQSGFVKKFRDDGSLAVEFLTDLFLTPESKLYKIGIFVAPDADSSSELPVGWEASVYDVAMTAGNRLTAAQYFYERFLGLAFPRNVAMYTKKFHDLTKAYIGGLPLSEEKKSDLHNALITYLKVEVSRAIHVDEFASLYFDEAVARDAFQSYMAANHFPLQQIQKDLSDIQVNLRFRRVVFPRDIKLTAPAESFGDMVTLETIQGDADSSGQVPDWTRITVKGRIQTQT
ncbi:MAG: hypothetical protein DDT34_02094 [Firmicutes bacterium]|nr:hypothetical protein [Bacillota bacterium]